MEKKMKTQVVPGELENLFIIDMVQEYVFIIRELLKIINTFINLQGR